MWCCLGLDDSVFTARPSPTCVPSNATGRIMILGFVRRPRGEDLRRDEALMAARNVIGSPA